MQYESVQQEVARLVCDIRNLETFLALPRAKEVWLENKERFDKLLNVAMFDPNIEKRYSARYDLRALTAAKRDPSLEDLRKEAGTLGISRYTRYNKPELIEVIKNAKLKREADIESNRQYQALLG